MTEVPHLYDETEPRLSVDEKLMSLGKELGFRETEEMRQLRTSLATIKEQAELDGNMKTYGLLGHEETNSLEGIDHMRAQIGYTIALAGIFYSLERLPEAQAEIAEAISYADNMGFDDVVNNLQQILAREKRKKQNPG